MRKAKIILRYTLDETWQSYLTLYIKISVAETDIIKPKILNNNKRKNGIKSYETRQYNAPQGSYTIVTKFTNKRHTVKWL